MNNLSDIFRRESGADFDAGAAEGFSAGGNATGTPSLTDSAETATRTRHTPKDKRRKAKAYPVRREKIMEYSLTNRILMECDPKYRAKAVDEFELTSAAADDWNNDLELNGFVMPKELQRDLTVANEGTDLVADEVQNTILSTKPNRPIVEIAGATVWRGLRGDISIPRATADPTAAWLSENGSNTESDPTFDQVNLSPTRVGGHVEISRRLLKQATPDIEAWVRNAIMRQVRLAIDAAAINGSGTSNEPEGIAEV